MLTLIFLVQGFIKWIAWFAFQAWDFVKTHRLLMWGVILQAAYIVWKVLNDPFAFMVDVLSFFSNFEFAWLGALGVPSGVTDILSFCNHVFPLDTLCVYTIAYLGILVQITLYRFIKSMIPSPLPGGGGT